MRQSFSDVVERARVKHGPYGSSQNDLYGAFFFVGPCGIELKVLATNGEGLKPQWEHVSVSTSHRCPNWQEMSWVKDLFWPEDECVVQFHPAKADYIDCHPYTLHLWRAVHISFPMPPKVAV